MHSVWCIEDNLDRLKTVAPSTQVEQQLLPVLNLVDPTLGRHRFSDRGLNARNSMQGTNCQTDRRLTVTLANLTLNRKQLGRCVSRRFFGVVAHTRGRELATLR